MKKKTVKIVQKEQIPATLKIASVLFFFTGGIYIIASVLGIFSAQVSSELGGSAGISVLLVSGIITLIAAYGLWRGRIYGGVIGVIILILNIISALPRLLQSAGAGAILGLGFYALLLVLIAINWKSLKK